MICEQGEAESLMKNYLLAGLENINVEWHINESECPKINPGVPKSAQSWVKHDLTVSAVMLGVVLKLTLLYTK